MKQVAGLLSLAAMLYAQPAPPSAPPRPFTPPRVVSPEVRPDRSVTFRFSYPNVKEVPLSREWGLPVPMQRNEQGIWTFTTETLDPDFYGYLFPADVAGHKGRGNCGYYHINAVRWLCIGWRLPYSATAGLPPASV